MHSMGRSKPFDLILALKTLWNAHEKNAGRAYTGTSRDLKEAKEWLQINAWDEGDITEFTDRIDRFIRDSFWEELDWPLWGFLKHINRYAPPRIAKKAKAVEMLYCEKCDSAYRSGTRCGCQSTQLKAIGGRQ